MFYWQVFIQCPKCSKKHFQLNVGFSAKEKVSFSAYCCDTTIGYDMSFLEAKKEALKRDVDFQKGKKETNN